MQVIVSGHVILDPTVLRIKSMTKPQVINLIIFFASILMVMFSKYILFPWDLLLLGGVIGSLVVNCFYLLPAIIRK